MEYYNFLLFLKQPESEANFCGVRKLWLRWEVKRHWRREKDSWYVYRIRGHTAGDIPYGIVPECIELSLEFEIQENEPKKENKNEIE